jgi:hypothetical protein
MAWQTASSSRVSRNPKEEPMPKVHSFHVVMADGKERNVKAGEARRDDGALVFVRENSTDEKVVIAAGQWTYYEVEAQDDRG